MLWTHVGVLLFLFSQELEGCSPETMSISDNKFEKSLFSLTKRLSLASPPNHCNSP